MMSPAPLQVKSGPTVGAEKAMSVPHLKPPWDGGGGRATCGRYLLTPPPAANQGPGLPPDTRNPCCLIPRVTLPQTYLPFLQLQPKAPRDLPAPSWQQTQGLTHGKWTAVTQAMPQA